MNSFSGYHQPSKVQTLTFSLSLVFISRCTIDAHVHISIPYYRPCTLLKYFSMQT